MNTRSGAVLVAAAVISLLLWPTHASGELAFSRATADEREYLQDPGKYRTRVVPSGPLYVERHPALVVPRGDVTRIVARKEYALDLEGRPRPGVAHYWISFHLARESARRLSEFLEAHDGRRLEMAVGGRRLTFVVVIGPFGGEEFSVPLAGVSKKTIERLLRPIPVKVEWQSTAGATR